MSTKELLRRASAEGWTLEMVVEAVLDRITELEERIEDLEAECFS